jgi:hypothetical protein
MPPRSAEPQAFRPTLLITALPYSKAMYTVAETDVFIRYAQQVWSADERDAFVTWIASNPLAGDVIPGTAGLRKVRYSRQGVGKRGGVRVVYYNL